MSTAVACWRGRSNVSVLVTKAEADQMHQRLCFTDEAEPASDAMDLDSKTKEGDELTGAHAARDDLTASHSAVVEDVQNGQEEQLL